jgi:hypothetical protein
MLIVYKNISSSNGGKQKQDSRSNGNNFRYMGKSGQRIHQLISQVVMRPCLLDVRGREQKGRQGTWQRSSKKVGGLKRSANSNMLRRHRSMSCSIGGLKRSANRDMLRRHGSMSCSNWNSIGGLKKSTNREMPWRLRHMPSSS